MHFKIWSFSVLICAGLCFQCTSGRQYTQKPTKSVLNPDEESVEVKSLIYHLNDTVSLLLLEIMNENLMYRRPDTCNAFYAEVNVRVQLLTDHGSRVILDSAGIQLSDRASVEIATGSLKTMFQLKVPKGKDYYADIKVLDLNKKIVYVKGQNVYKSNNFGRQNYLVNVKGNVSFQYLFKERDTLNIETNMDKDQYTVDYFKGDFKPAFPPFSTMKGESVKYTADSSFRVLKINGKMSLIMPNNGFYHIRSNSDTRDGLSLYCFGNAYPGLNNSEEMIRATRYIMSKDEFENCLRSDDQKKAIDDFWLNIGGSRERAKELLKKYYSRVKEANKFYTSYCEGWKSDRGMLMIVLGKPNYIYKGVKTETWLYGLESNPNAIRYVFVKTNNPFSDNDYTLERSQFYKEHWYQAVDIWRQGHVYMNQQK